MKTIKIFIASSSELREDRDEFRIFISKENDRLHKKGIYLEVVQWENYLDAISDSRLQDEYNNAIRECDIVLCLFFTKVGKYSAEEFDTAYQVFKDKGKPKIWTYFKNADISTGSITDEINTLLAFKKKIASLGHFYTEYTNIDNLINQYRGQLDKFLPEFKSAHYSDEYQTIVSKSSKEVSLQIENNFNEILTQRLINAIEPFNRKAREFLKLNADWYERPELHSTVKRIIISGYVGILGIQLRKLMSIGEEEHSVDKMTRYLNNVLDTARRSLQLTAYSLLSVLWDFKKNNPFSLSADHMNILVRFFQNVTEDSLDGYARLIKTLLEIYSDNNIDFPFPQLSELQPNLDEGSDFMLACVQLDEIADKLSSKGIDLEDCINAEKNLAKILESLSFLVEYKMVSIKEVNFSKQRNHEQGLYLHNYSLLEGDRQANNSNRRRVKKETDPVFSYSVLLCKDSLKQNINLDPFIIDYNALGLKGGSKVCVYSSCNTYDDLGLNYTFIEDNTRISLKKSSNPKPDEKNIHAVNIWLADIENRKDLNYDTVYQLFHEAKKTLAGLEEETPEAKF